MADEKCWMTFGISGVGQVAAWVDPANLDSTVSIPEYIEAENLSMVVYLPNQVLVQKLAENGILNVGACGMLIRTPANVVELLAKQWDRVAVFKSGDAPRIVRHD